MNPAGNNISPNSLGNYELIGEGAFGKVYKADYEDRNGDEYPVAVKILNGNSRDAVLNEKNRLAYLDHDNIVKLIGIVLHPDDSDDQELPYIVLEYMPNGDLYSYLNDYYTTAAQRICWAYEIACGMSYLHDEGEDFHGDLAARNCLLDKNLRIKIGDFGRLDSNNDEYYVSYNGEDFNLPCPIRWMAPENFSALALYPNGQYYQGRPTFTCEGDVWAFGIVLYELWSQGKTPYDGLNDNQVIRAVNDNKGPRHYDDKFTARRHIIDLMDWCMNLEPNERPTFDDIMEDLKDNEPGILRNY